MAAAEVNDVEQQKATVIQRMVRMVNAKKQAKRLRTERASVVVIQKNFRRTLAIQRKKRLYLERKEEEERLRIEEEERMRVAEEIRKENERLLAIERRREEGELALMRAEE